MIFFLNINAPLSSNGINSASLIPETLAGEGQERGEPPGSSLPGAPQGQVLGFPELPPLLGLRGALWIPAGEPVRRLLPKVDNLMGPGRLL